MASNFTLVNWIFQNLISLKETIYRVSSSEKAMTSRLSHDGISLIQEGTINPEPVQVPDDRFFDSK